ncbi:rod shape-determining protein MreD [Pantoea sp. Mhis]|uniref:rod shape-determining protein MreD n=1 Tax=Pantoea sp. Mhis TaxID=2576759 RepID=UPI0013576534|nr:rod shape-determining protein MreD [Pantoea sp. Mhis]MXP56367.1 rod shape-determining protein MreD [Pantoea sp. Mhis]
MSRYSSNRYWVIWFSFMIALLLQIVPWPPEIYIYLPLWLLLTLIYWILALPHRISIGTGFLLGCITDLVTGSVLGSHALAFSVITYLVTLKCYIFRKLPLWKQAFIIMILSFTMNFIIFFANYLIIRIPLRAEIFCSTISNGIVWPWLFLFMRRMRRRFKIQ